jgi:hypothetical protein
MTAQEYADQLPNFFIGEFWGLLGANFGIFLSKLLCGKGLNFIVIIVVFFSPCGEVLLRPDNIFQPSKKLS